MARVPHCANYTPQERSVTRLVPDFSRRDRMSNSVRSFTMPMPHPAEASPHGCRLATLVRPGRCGLATCRAEMGSFFREILPWLAWHAACIWLPLKPQRRGESSADHSSGAVGADHATLAEKNIAVCSSPRWPDGGRVRRHVGIGPSRLLCCHSNHRHSTLQFLHQFGQFHRQLSCFSPVRGRRILAGPFDRSSRSDGPFVALGSYRLEVPCIVSRG